MTISGETVTVQFTAQECEFIVKLIGQISVSPASKDAASIVELVQAVLAKLMPNQ